MDLNGDGYDDIVSGSWPGEIFFFKGGPNHTFASPEMLKDKDGKIINVGGGIKEESSGRILIYGNATFEQRNGKTVVIYQGKEIENTPEKSIGITGTASTVRFADWDGDGDYDLIIGYIHGEVYLLINEGTPQEYAFGKEQQIAKVSSRAGPFVADWDEDGDLDLLVGADNGSVSLFENKGSRKSPKLASAVEIVPPSESMTSDDVPRDPRRGSRSKICVADWNNDGKLDLLLGDFSSQKPDLPEPSPEKKAENDKLKKDWWKSMERSRYIKRIVGELVA